MVPAPKNLIVTIARSLARRLIYPRGALYGLGVILSLSIVGTTSQAQTLPLKTESGKRYLVDQSGTPVFLQGDAAWSLIVQTDYSGASQYLSDRAARGYNAVLVNLVEHHFADNAPANLANMQPFTGAPFTTPNPAYFAYADSVIDLANQLGITVLLAPVYLGYQCGDEGWCTAVQATSIAGMRSWGQYVGSRYKNYSNIIWVIGGDTDPSPVRDRIDSMTAALQSADNTYPDRIFTAHGAPGAPVTTYFPESWLDLNNTYTWNLGEVIPLAESAYNHAPTRPFIFMEGNYEGSNGITLQQIRAQVYWSFLRGAVGQVFGNNPIWYFGSKVVSGSNEDWVSALNSAGNQMMQDFVEFVKARHWYTLIPDQTGAVLTGGELSGTDQATAAYASDSTTILTYMPSRRTVTINPSNLTGNRIHVQWFSPSTGTYTDAGIVAKGTGNFTPPTAGDWVLVLDAVLDAPTPPVLQSPTDGAVGTAANPILLWSASADATSYRVQVATDATFLNLVFDRQDITATSKSIGGLFYNTTYFWRVSASNSGGSSSFSSAWSFTTEASTTCCVGIRGNVNNDPNDEINILDLTYLVSYMFRSGPQPPCEFEADIDASGGAIDIADLVYLQGYMFRGQSAPPACPSDTIGRNPLVSPGLFARF